MKVLKRVSPMGTKGILDSCMKKQLKNVSKNGYFAIKRRTVSLTQKIGQKSKKFNFWPKGDATLLLKGL